MPWMWLIAGPNGSGKSTAIDDNFMAALTTESLYKLNPDVRTREIRADNPSLQLVEANLLAAQQIDSEVDQLISEGLSFVVETVLSTDKYKSKLEDAKRRGFNVGFVYITLATPQDNVDRVTQRVQQGGHCVPPEKIRARWERSITNLAWFVEKADFALVFDNTAPAGPNNEPRLLASKTLGGSLQLRSKGYHPRVDAELLSLLDSSDT